jgi:hypothetical protein
MTAMDKVHTLNTSAQLMFVVQVVHLPRMHKPWHQCLQMLAVQQFAIMCILITTLDNQTEKQVLIA